MGKTVGAGAGGADGDPVTTDVESACPCETYAVSVDCGGY